MLKNKLFIILFFYHLIFIIFFYSFVQFYGGDAFLYWGKTGYFQNHSWINYADYGADFILFLNYPFIAIKSKFHGACI